MWAAEVFVVGALGPFAGNRFSRKRNPVAIESSTAESTAPIVVINRSSETDVTSSHFA
jgi:hypothetical protein